MDWRPLRASLVGLVSIAVVAIVATGAQSQQASPDYTGRIDETPRFHGEARIRIDERDVSVEIDMRNWMIVGGTRIKSLPLEIRGLMIVQLKGGELTTMIEGAERERFEGEIWTVAPGVEMGIQTEDDSAILQTIVVAGPGQG